MHHDTRAPGAATAVKEKQEPEAKGRANLTRLRMVWVSDRTFVLGCFRMFYEGMNI